MKCPILNLKVVRWIKIEILPPPTPIKKNGRPWVLSENVHNWHSTDKLIYFDIIIVLSTSKLYEDYKHVDKIKTVRVSRA